MGRSKDNPINICDWCEQCDDKFRSLHNCMCICGAPLDILQAIEKDRNEQEDTDMTKREGQALKERIQKLEQENATLQNTISTMKTGIITMLTDLQTDIDHGAGLPTDRLVSYADGVDNAVRIIQSKINDLRAEIELQENEDKDGSTDN